MQSAADVRSLVAVPLPADLREVRGLARRSTRDFVVVARGWFGADGLDAYLAELNRTEKRGDRTGSLTALRGAEAIKWGREALAVVKEHAPGLVDVMPRPEQVKVCAMGFVLSPWWSRPPVNVVVAEGASAGTLVLVVVSGAATFSDGYVAPWYCW